MVYEAEFPPIYSFKVNSARKVEKTKDPLLSKRRMDFAFCIKADLKRNTSNQEIWITLSPYQYETNQRYVFGIYEVENLKESPLPPVKVESALSLAILQRHFGETLIS